MSSPPVARPVQLPQEVLQMIIDVLIPSNLHPIALAPSHITTKTLLAILRSSLALYSLALRPLYTHCLYIDSSTRLIALTRTLHAFQEREAAGGPQSRLPRISILPHITSLYLDPGFSSDEYVPPSQLVPVSDLLLIVGTTLKRLIWKVPTRSVLWHFDDGYLSAEQEARDIREILWQCLSPLKQLELFSSVLDSMDILMDFNARFEEPTSFRNIFNEWPKCKILALYNPDLSLEDFWRRWSKMPHLKRLIATRSDGIDEVDINALWSELPLGRTRGLDVELVNVDGDHKIPSGRANWSKDAALQVREVSVPISYYGDEDAIDLCQRWVARCLLRGDETVEGCEPTPMMVM